MSRATQVGITAGVAVTLAIAGLGSPATATSAGSQASGKPSAGAHVNGASPDKAFTPAARSEAIGLATSEEPKVARAFHLTGAQKLHVKGVERDADGTLHIHYNRTLGGLKVFGGDFIVHQSASGRIKGAEFAASNPLTLKANAPTKVSAAQAARVVARSVHASTSILGSAKKVVWAVDGIPRLAWYTRVVEHDSHGNPIPRAVVVDAATGRVIQSWDLLQTDEGTGDSLYVGDVTINTTPIAGPAFEMRDPLHGDGRTFDVNNGSENPPGVPPLAAMSIFTDADNAWGNGATTNRASAAVDVVYGTAETWDYYEQTFGRNGIANDGVSARSRVHYGVDFDNAFWSDACFCMTYGDGSGDPGGFNTLVGLDVIGHEMTHGVTSRTAGLYYFGDAGGLNEATSDIFGASIEFFANNATDVGDYFIGENVTVSDPFLRQMDNPHAGDGVSINCWSGHTGLADVHFSSGVGNHFFYLLAEGSGAKTINGVNYNSPVCGNAAAVGGIGRGKAARIWYRALTRYFVSTTNYIDARDATIHAAIDLFGKGSPACNQVVKAWNAVKVPKQYWTCNGGLKEGKSTIGKSPGFEKDRGVWSVSGVAGITNLNAFPPHRGNWYTGMNNAGAVSNATLSRKVNVPDTATATLRFYMFMSVASSADASVWDSGGSVNVFMNGRKVAHFTQAYANNSYIRWDVDVHRFRGKNGVNLVIKSHEQAPDTPGVGYFFALLDDFTLTPR